MLIEWQLTYSPIKYEVLIIENASFTSESSQVCFLNQCFVLSVKIHPDKIGIIWMQKRSYMDLFLHNFYWKAACQTKLYVVTGKFNNDCYLKQLTSLEQQRKFNYISMRNIIQFYKTKLCEAPKFSVPLQNASWVKHLWLTWWDRKCFGKNSLLQVFQLLIWTKVFSSKNINVVKV